MMRDIGGRPNRSSDEAMETQWSELYKLWNRLSSGSYFPQAVKEVSIPKKDGGRRKLGVPSVLDRIAQQVVRVHLEKIVEPHFHDSSLGYRPKRSCHNAVKQSCSNCFNHDFVIDLDIKAFFDTIDHDLLIRAVERFCFDKGMDKHHPEKPFERYADDVVVHCKTEK